MFILYIYFLIHCQIFFFFKYRLYIGYVHPAVQDIGIGCQKTHIGWPLIIYKSFLAIQMYLLSLLINLMLINAM